jgi:hypothetical protein
MGPDELCLELARYILAEYPQITVSDIDLGYCIQAFAEKAELHLTEDNQS